MFWSISILSKSFIYGANKSPRKSLILLINNISFGSSEVRLVSMKLDANNGHDSQW